MKLCVLANLYAKKPLDEALAILKSHGVEAVEIGCGGYPGKDHADPDILLNDEKAFSLLRIYLLYKPVYLIEA